MARLTKRDYTMRDVYLSSLLYYDKFDDKANRAKMDVKKSKVTLKTNIKYNPSTRKWEQTGRDIKIVCMVTTDPISYNRPPWDKKLHKFPVTFLIHNLDAGFDSSFKWRTGSFKKPKFPKNGMSKEFKQKLQEQNIKNGVQLQFFFELEYLLKRENLLFGICYANRPATIANPKNEVFFDKHALYTMNRIIYPFITSKKGIYTNLIARSKMRKL